MRRAAAAGRSRRIARRQIGVAQRGVGRDLVEEDADGRTSAGGLADRMGQIEKRSRGAGELPCFRLHRARSASVTIAMARKSLTLLPSRFAAYSSSDITRGCGLGLLGGLRATTARTSMRPIVISIGCVDGGASIDSSCGTRRRSMTRGGAMRSRATVRTIDCGRRGSARRGAATDRVTIVVFGVDVLSTIFGDRVPLDRDARRRHLGGSRFRRRQRLWRTLRRKKRRRFAARHSSFPRQWRRRRGRRKIAIAGRRLSCFIARDRRPRFQNSSRRGSTDSPNATPSSITGSKRPGRRG